MIFEGYNGRFAVADDGLLLSRDGARGRFGGDAAPQHIALEDVAGAFLEPPEPRRPGYLHVLLVGEPAQGLTMAEAVRHAHVVTFTAAQAEAFHRLYEWLEYGGELVDAQTPDEDQLTTQLETVAPAAVAPRPVAPPPSRSPQVYGQGAVGPSGWTTAPVAQRGSAPVVASDQDINVVVVVIAWVLALGTLGYLLPWAIAASRGKSNATAIGLLNFFIGWTGVGWVAALIMACGAHQSVQVAGTQVNVLLAQQYQPQAPQLVPADWYPAPDGPGQRYWDGDAWTEHRAP